MAVMTTPVAWHGLPYHRSHDSFGSVEHYPSSIASNSKIKSVRPPLPPLPLFAIPVDATRPREQRIHVIHTPRLTPSSPNSLRPLPPVPRAPSLPPAPKGSMRPLPPIPHAKNNIKTPPQSVRPLPTRRDSLSHILTMATPAPLYVPPLASPASDASSVIGPVSPSPLSPTLSPIIAKQEMVYGVSEDGIVVSRVLEKVRGLGEFEFEVASSPSSSSVDEEKEEDSYSENDSDTDIEFDDDLQEPATVQVIEKRLVMMGATIGAYQSTKSQRHSRQWVREQGGHRWVENDYADVIQFLRRL